MSRDDEGRAVIVRETVIGIFFVLVLGILDLLVFLEMHFLVWSFGAI